MSEIELELVSQNTLVQVNEQDVTISLSTQNTINTILGIPGNSSSGGGTPGGSDGQIQYNNGGTFGGTNVYYDNATGFTGFNTNAPTGLVNIVGQNSNNFANFLQGNSTSSYNSFNILLTDNSVNNYGISEFHSDPEAGTAFIQVSGDGLTSSGYFLYGGGIGQEFTSQTTGGVSTSILQDATSFTFISSAYPSGILNINGTSGDTTINHGLTVIGADNLTTTNIIAAYAQNLTQGFANRFDGLYAIGSNTDVNINIVPKGAGAVIIPSAASVAGVLTATATIVASGGYNSLSGLRISGADASNSIYQNTAWGLASRGGTDAIRFDGAGNINTAGAHFNVVGKNLTVTGGELIASNSAGGTIADFTNGTDVNFDIALTVPGAGTKYALVGSQTNTQIRLGNNSTGFVNIDVGGKVGFGSTVTSPSAQVHIILTTEQLRVGYDTSNYYSTTVSSTGGVTFDAFGSGAGFTFSDSIALGVNNLTMTGSLGTTGARLTKGWFTDLQVTNAIAGSITGNASTVTNATLTTALTVNTGTITLTGNVANTSVLTIGAGAVSVSGINTGDQTSVTGNAGTATALQNARTIGGVSFNGTANITVATAIGGFTVTGNPLAVGNTASGAYKLEVFDTGSATTADTVALFQSGAAPPAGNIVGIGILKSGTEELLLGINKNTTTGSVPANSAFISTLQTTGTLSLGRGTGGSTPSTSDIFIDGSGHVGIGQTASLTAFLDVAAATTSLASARLRQGTAPSSPNDGDIWGASNHLYTRLNGVTYQLDQQSGGGVDTFAYSYYSGL